MLRAILFDLHGVLLDDEPLHLRLLQELADFPIDPVVFFERYAGVDDRSAIARLWHEQGRTLQPGEIRNIAAEKARRYAKSTLAFHPGARALVAEAVRRAPVGIVTRLPREEAKAVLKELGLFDKLTALVTGDEVPGLPSPMAWEQALAAINRDLSRRRQDEAAPRNVLVFEDTEAGLRAAKTVGLKVAAVAHTQRLQRLEAADAVAARLVDFELGALERELF